MTGTKRYSEIKKAMPQITHKVLIQHLKQLEEDNLIIRKAKPVVPPYVTYSLSAIGKKLHPVLYSMAVWSVESAKQNSKEMKRKLEDFPKI